MTTIASDFSLIRLLVFVRDVVVVARVMFALIIWWHLFGLLLVLKHSVTHGRWW